MEGATRCTVCLEQYTANAGTPTILLCGHTFCRQCVADLYGHGDNVSATCPMCREVTRAAPADLPTNFALLALLEKVVNERQPRDAVAKWCLDCKQVADTACQDEHTTCPLRKEQERQLLDIKRLMVTSVASKHALESTLRDTFGPLTDAVEVLLGEAEAARQDTEEALTVLNCSLGTTGPEWDRVVGMVQLARLRCIHTQAFDKQSVEFMQSARRCDVTVREQHGRIWRGTFDLEDDSNGVVLAMASVLQRARLMSPVGEQEYSSGLAATMSPPPAKRSKLTLPTSHRATRPENEVQATPMALVPSFHTVEEEVVVVSSDEELDVGPSNKPEAQLRKESLGNADPSSTEHKQSVSLIGGQEIDCAQYGVQLRNADILFAPLNPPVISITKLSCNFNTPAALKILQCHGPTLERLHLDCMVIDVLDAVLAMPLLKSLAIDNFKGCNKDLIRFCSSSNVLRLDTLSVYGCCSVETTTIDILRIIGGARHLALKWASDAGVGVLVDFLRDKSPRSLKFLRGSSGCRRKDRCNAQCTAIAKVVPGADVWCDIHHPDHVLLND